MSGRSQEERLKQLVSMHYKSITEGCGDSKCTNPHCRSNPAARPELERLSKPAAFKMAVEDVQHSAPHCVAMLPQPQPQQQQQQKSFPQPVKGLAELLEIARTEGLPAYVHDVFACPESLARSLIDPSTPAALLQEAPFLVAPISEEVSDVYAAIAEGANEALALGMNELSSQAVRPRLWQNPRAVAIALLNPAVWEWDAIATGALEKLLSTAASLPQPAVVALEHVLGNGLPYGELANLVGRAQTALSTRVMTMGDRYSPGSDSFVHASVAVLGIMFRANGRCPRARQVRFTDFHNSVLTERLDLREDYVLWTQPSVLGLARKSMLSSPWVLDAAYKRKAMQIESLVEQRQRRQEALQQVDPLTMFFGGQVPNVSLPVHVRRENVLEDSLSALEGHDPLDFKMQLRVEFHGEAGLDHGGVQKEWFQLVVQRVFDTRFGMFVYNQATRTFWFNPLSDSLADFKLIGILLGLAIYNNVVLDVHFPMVVYHKLLVPSFEPQLDDLEDIYPDMQKSFKQLLATPIADPEDLGLSFEVEYDYYGAICSRELLPGGKNIPVTESNKAEYVRLRLRWIFVDSVAQQFNKFREGFMSVIAGSRAMGLFTPEELELVICGSPKFDFRELENSTRYEGFEPGDQVVLWFWQVIHSMTPEQHRLFLAFTTGCDRCPIGGLKDLRMIISKNGDDDEMLPTASTCFNHLLLPQYSSKEKLSAKLLQAIENCQGFGLA